MGQCFVVLHAGREAAAAGREAAAAGRMARGDEVSPVGPSVGDHAGGRHVCQQHKLLHQLIGLLLRGGMAWHGRRRQRLGSRREGCTASLGAAPDSTAQARRRLSEQAIKSRSTKPASRLLIHAVVAGVALAIQLEEQARVVQPQRAVFVAPPAQRGRDARQGQAVGHDLQAGGVEKGRRSRGRQSERRPGKCARTAQQDEVRQGWLREEQCSPAHVWPAVPAGELAGRLLALLGCNGSGGRWSAAAWVRRKRSARVLGEEPLARSVSPKQRAAQPCRLTQIPPLDHRLPTPSKHSRQQPTQHSRYFPQLPPHSPK